MAVTGKYKGSYTPVNSNTGWVEAYGEWYTKYRIKGYMNYICFSNGEK